MSEYVKLKTQIKKLQKKANNARRKEINQNIRRVKKIIKIYNLSAKDLGLNKPEIKEKGFVINSLNSNLNEIKKTDGRWSVKAKYKDPITGVTWSGRGIKPKWFVLALSNGKKKTDLEIRK